MSTGSEESQTRMSRRKLIKTLSAAMMAAGGAGVAVGQSAGKVVQTPPPPQEHCLIYELITLWLVFSTNKKFVLTVDNIVNATGLPKQRVTDALVIYQQNKDDFNSAVDTFGELINLYTNPLYQPGECPLNLSTLGPIMKIAPPSPCK